MNNPPPARASRNAILGRSNAGSRLARARILDLLALLTTCILASLGHLAVAQVSHASVGATDRQWSWPLAGSPTIVRGFEPPTQPWLAGHRGIDLLASAGAPVLAAGAGRVSFAGWVGGLPVVTVTHPDGRRTTYQPVLAAVARGSDVARGAIVGRVSAGGSHCLPRVCLHWGLRLGSSYLDPLSLVSAGLEVRLLPLWSPGPPSTGPPSTGPPSTGAPSTGPPSAEPPSAGPTAFVVSSPARTGLARLGALNRARAMGSLMT